MTQACHAKGCRRFYAALLALALASCSSPRSPAASSNKDDASPDHSSTPLKLLVIIIVDQLPSWSFQRDRQYLGRGFKRALENAVYVPRAAYPYAITYTAPGHAALATGAPPSDTGILANSWYRRKSKRKQSAVDDPRSPVFMLGGQQPSGGVSSSQLRLEGLADMHAKQTGGRGKSVSIALKDRSAVLALGKRPSIAVWYDDSQRAMTTSSFYATTPPSWLLALQNEAPIESYLRREWKPENPELLARVTGVPDDQAGEGTGHGWGRSMPHSLATASDPQEALVLTPAGTEYLFATAEAAVLGENLGQDDVIDLLSISVSSHDFAGHHWGQESWERLDLLLRLDATLGDFFEFLDRDVGRGSYAIVITSDHGASPLIELSRAAGKSAYRVEISTLTKVASEAAQKRLGPGTWVTAYAASTLFMSPAFLQLDASKQEPALDAIVTQLRKVPGVGFVSRTDQIRGQCAARRGTAEMACLSVSEESGEIFVAPQENSLLTNGYETGTGHGSPADHDRFVPLILSAPGLRTMTVTQPVSMLQLAPTLSDLIGIPRPPGAMAPSLFDQIKQ